MRVAGWVLGALSQAFALAAIWWWAALGMTPNVGTACLVTWLAGSFFAVPLMLLGEDL